MKFFICGCNGMAGHTISLYLQEKGHEVYGFDLQESKLIKSFAGNAFDTEIIARVIKEGNYDTVINCIGVLNRFAEDNHALAAFLNSYFPHFLAKTTEGTDTQVIHMTTDCVFSGKKGSYTEHDLRDGFYIKSLFYGAQLSSYRDMMTYYRYLDGHGHFQGRLDKIHFIWSWIRAYKTRKG